MDVESVRGKRIGFAASGGLDSCTITHWLAEQGAQVVCFTGDIGQTDEDTPDAIEKRMRGSGAEDYFLLDLQDEMAEAGLKVIQAQATYEGNYWNTTGAARQVLVHGLVPDMLSRGINVFSHGATGRGNDQVRFQVIAARMTSELEFYAPWRDSNFLNRFRGRREMLAYCEQHGIPIKASRDKPYSTDANLLGLTHEGGMLEDLEVGPEIVTPGMGAWPWDAAEKMQDIQIRFEEGRPVSLNGKEMSLRKMFESLNEIGGEYGIGIATNLVENRFVGVKSRGVYEAPAMNILGTAYQRVLEVILDRQSKDLFDHLSLLLGRQIYQGNWDDFASEMAWEAIDRVRARVTGDIHFGMYRGQLVSKAIRNVPHSLYSEDGSMEDEGTFDHRDSEGLLNILTLTARAGAKAKIG